MKWVETPNWIESLKDHQLWKLLSEPEVSHYVNRMNVDYLHYSDLKYRPFP